jgi:hypothetical protein
VYTDVQPGLRLVQNHTSAIAANIDLAFPVLDLAPPYIWVINLSRDLFDTAVSDIVQEYTGEYNQLTYTDRVFEPFELSPSALLQGIHHQRLRLTAWQALQHPRFGGVVNLDYSQLFGLNGLTGLWAMLKLPNLPTRSLLKREISKPNPRSAASMITNYDQLRSAYLNNTL